MCQKLITLMHTPPTPEYTRNSGTFVWQNASYLRLPTTRQKTDGASPMRRRVSSTANVPFGLFSINLALLGKTFSRLPLSSPSLIAPGCTPSRAVMSAAEK